MSKGWWYSNQLRHSMEMTSNNCFTANDCYGFLLKASCFLTGVKCSSVTWLLNLSKKLFPPPIYVSINFNTWFMTSQYFSSCQVHLLNHLQATYSSLQESNIPFSTMWLRWQRIKAIQNKAVSAKYAEFEMRMQSLRDLMRKSRASSVGGLGIKSRMTVLSASMGSNFGG